MEQVVAIPNSLYRSVKGRYFAGQTEMLTFGNGVNAWAGLTNGRNSNIDGFVNTFTFTNFSDLAFTAQICLRASSPYKAMTSPLYAPTNSAIIPAPIPRIKIKYLAAPNLMLNDGINVYQRIIPTKATVVVEDDGKSIIGPCEAFSLLLIGSSSTYIDAVVAFGWFEEPIKY